MFPCRSLQLERLQHPMLLGFGFSVCSAVSVKWYGVRLSQQGPTAANTHTHTHPFNGPLSGTTQVSRYQKGKTNLDFTEERDSGWQWHQLGYMQVCTALQTDNHTSTPPLLCFLQAGCPSCRPTNSVKALKATAANMQHQQPIVGRRY